MATQEPLLSIVIPLYNEEGGFPQLFEKLREVKSQLPARVEFIFVDDGSVDKTFELLSTAARQETGVTALRLARNYGSHAAVMAGIGSARGDCALFMAGDSQDPPSLIVEMLDQWRKGAKLVWAARERVEKQSFKDRLFSLCYWGLYNLSVDYPVPAGGVDFALVDRVIIDEMRRRPHSRQPLFAQVGETGVPYTVVRYLKGARTSGKSGWTLRKKFGLVFQTLFMSDKPIFWSAGFVSLLLVASAVLSCLAILRVPGLRAYLIAVCVAIHLSAIGLTVILSLLTRYQQGLLLEAAGTPRFIVAECVGSDVDTQGTGGVLP